MARKTHTFIDINSITGSRFLLNLLHEPGTNSDPQVHVVVAATLKAEAVKTLGCLGLPWIFPADLKVSETYLGSITLREAGLLTEGRAFAFRDYRNGGRVVELLGKDRAAVIGIFTRTSEYAFPGPGPLSVELIVAE